MRGPADPALQHHDEVDDESLEDEWPDEEWEDEDEGELEEDEPAPAELTRTLRFGLFAMAQHYVLDGGLRGRARHPTVVLPAGRRALVKRQQATLIVTRAAKLFVAVIRYP